MVEQRSGLLRIQIEPTTDCILGVVCTPSGQHPLDDDLVWHLDAPTRQLRINLVGTTIDRVASPFFVGDVVLGVGPGPGEIRVHTSSQAVSAALMRVSCGM